MGQAPVEPAAPLELAALAALLGRHGRQFTTRFEGSSMEPAIPSGAEVLLHCGVEPAVGEVVAVAHQGQVLVHRLVARSGRWLLTRGDALLLPDPPLWDSTAVIGRVEKVRRGDVLSEVGPPPGGLGRRLTLGFCLGALRLHPQLGAALIGLLASLRHEWLQADTARRERRGPTRRTLLLLLASCLFSLVLGELLVRVLAPQPVRPAWDDVVDGVRALKPGIAGRHRVPGVFDVSVHVGPQRFRGERPVSPAPAPGITRLAVLGDSFAFGWGAGDEEAYPAQLERRLGHGVEVLNAGVPATSLGEKALWYDLWVKAFHPRIVILTVVADDVDGDLFWRLFRLQPDGGATPRPLAERRRVSGALGSLGGRLKDAPGYGWLAQRSQLFALLRKAASLAFSPDKRLALATHPENAEYESSIRRRFDSEGLPLAAAEVRWLQARVNEEGSQLLVVFAPGAETVESGARDAWATAIAWRSEALTKALATVCRERAIPFGDLTAPLQARPTGEPLFHRGADTHPTPAGYRALAEEVAALLTGQGGPLSPEGRIGRSGGSP